MKPVFYLKNCDFSENMYSIFYNLFSFTHEF